MHFDACASEILATQRLNAESIRNRDAGECIDQHTGENAASAAAEREARATTVSIEEIVRGPGAVARKLADDAKLNLDQRRLVALFAWPMQKQWNEALSKTPQLGDTTSKLWESFSNQERPLLPLVGVIARVLFIGGGGCGKSLVITRVLTPLLKTFYGPFGLMIEAASNKAARGVGGITLHAANKLMGSSSLITIHLRPKERQKAAMARYRRLGAKLFDEVSQLNT